MIRIPRGHAVVLWCVAPFLLWLTLFRPEAGDGGRAARVPATLADYTVAERYELTDEVVAMLGTPDATQRRYAGPDGEVFVVAVFHDANWKSVHAPDTCLRGSNMDVIDDRVVTRRGAVGDDLSYGRLRLHALDRGRGYLSCYVYLAAPDFMAGDYTSFSLHHAPRALWRASVAGCLLRVETWVDGDDWDAAEARCTAVLRPLVELSWELMQ